ncbi:MAG: glycine/betaine ABC transporter substrate-binding protein [Eubacterium sp.]|nr:glycine/betaine ABC transporter substrate-binding protein [Eubacterium sp.]
MKKTWKKWVALGMTFGMIAGIAGCGNSKNAGSESTTEAAKKQEAAAPIKIATKPMTEQFILGEMLKLVIEDTTDYSVELTKGIGGGTNNIMPAMESGDFDLYPEYTSSGYIMVLKHDSDGISDEDMWKQLQKEYKDKYDMSWIGQYGFNNTYALIVREEAAKKYNLTKTSQLAEVSDELVFGGNSDYIERKDGFHLLCDTYGLKFKDVKDIDIGLKYEALKKGDIDVSNGFTTDVQLSNDNVRVLEDDKHLQVNYFCSNVVRNDTLKSHPGLEEAIMKLDNSITDKEMASLNYKVEVEGKEDVQVAKDYLTEKGIIK